MFIILTVDNMHYDGQLITFPDHKSAWYYATSKLHGWYDIQRIY